MGDFVELANSYYRLLRWVETADVEKKNTALRSLDRMKRFLEESNVEIIDLTAQPFSEGWAVKVMKIDDTVPENELVFTKMVKPIIQINGEVVQEGEVYAGRLGLTATENDQATDNSSDLDKTNDQLNTDNIETPGHSESNSSHISWIMAIMEKIKSFQPSSTQFISTILGLVAIILIIMIACGLGGHSIIQADIAALSKRIDEYSLLDNNGNVTYQIQNGDNRIIITQPIGEYIVSTIDMNGTPVTITTTGNVALEGE